MYIIIQTEYILWYTTQKYPYWFRAILGGFSKKKIPSETWAKTINVFRACLGAQLTICAQKWRNFVLFSTVSFRFVSSRVCVFLYSLGPWTHFHSILGFLEFSLHSPLVTMHIKVAELNTPSDGNGASHHYTFLKFANIKMVCKYLQNNRLRKTQ